MLRRMEDVITCVGYKMKPMPRKAHLPLALLILTLYAVFVTQYYLPRHQAAVSRDAIICTVTGIQPFREVCGGDVCTRLTVHWQYVVPSTKETRYDVRECDSNSPSNYVGYVTVCYWDGSAMSFDGPAQAMGAGTIAAMACVSLFTLSIIGILLMQFKQEEDFAEAVAAVAADPLNLEKATQLNKLADELDRKVPPGSILGGARFESRFAQLAGQPLPMPQPPTLSASILGGAQAESLIAQLAGLQQPRPPPLPLPGSILVV
jgi:hypothetical protein